MSRKEIKKYIYGKRKEYEPPKKYESTKTYERKEQNEKKFNWWDGTLPGVNENIKNSMHNPKSYEPVETTYRDMGNYLIVNQKFRGTNAFGATVTENIAVKTDLNGNVLSK